MLRQLEGLKYTHLCYVVLDRRAGRSGLYHRVRVAVQARLNCGDHVTRQAQVNVRQLTDGDRRDRLPKISWQGWQSTFDIC